MSVDPELQPILELVNAVPAPLPDGDEVTGLRAAFALLCSTFGDGPAMADEVDDLVAGPGGEVPVRRYRPRSAPAGPAGALVFLHGGGFVLGGIETHHQLCRHLADASGAVVVSVGYRLAPEHRFPAAVEDALAATRATVERGMEWGIDPARVAVGGDSAGGNLAAVVARRWRDQPGPRLRLQVLLYPVCDLSHDTVRFPSLAENAEGYLLTSETMRFFAATYLPDATLRSHPDASPIEATDLTGLPPAHVVVAGYDPLRDEGLAYARRLTEAGVPVEVRRDDGAVHAYLQMADRSGLARAAVQDVAGAVRRAVDPPAP
jgi:acetyl esterase